MEKQAHLQKILSTMLLVGSLLLVGVGCIPSLSSPVDPATEIPEEEPISVAGTWTLTFWDERYPDTPISTTGTFFADGTAKTDSSAHYTIKGNQITVTADNKTTISVGIIEDPNTISGTWKYPEKGTNGTWKGERLEEIE